MEKEDRYDILFVGLDPALEAIAETELSGLSIHKLRTGEAFLDFLDVYQLTPGTPVLVSNACKDIKHFEVAQAVSLNFPGTRVIFITHERKDLQLAQLKKNGFAESFFLPGDGELFKEVLADIRSGVSGEEGAVRRFKPVKLVDIEPGMHLPFAVHTFLPLNRKFTLLTASGCVSRKKAEMLGERLVNYVYVERTDLDRFYEFTADHLLALGTPDTEAVSQTQKQEKLRHAVREIFLSVLDNDESISIEFENGRQLMEQANQIIQKFILKKTGIDLADLLKDVVGETSDGYLSARAVSSIGALIALGTGLASPEDLAVAGLFHDLGVLAMGRDVTPADVAGLTPAELAAYHAHPVTSVNLLREKKITVTMEIAAAIEAHHERVDKKGFPHAWPAHKISAAAQVLAYADAFEYLTRPQKGKEILGVEEVHSQIVRDRGLAPEILEKIQIFLKIQPGGAGERPKAG